MDHHLRSGTVIFCMHTHTTKMGYKVGSWLREYPPPGSLWPRVHATYGPLSNPALYIQYETNSEIKV